jgi:hypothetical protein
MVGYSVLEDETTYSGMTEESILLMNIFCFLYLVELRIAGLTTRAWIGLALLQQGLSQFD